MRKRLLLVLTIILSFSICGNVSACGEINELKSSVGTISKIGEMTYLVTIPEGTTEVTLEGSTDYNWIEGYGPRRVSTTDGKVELKVDGNACGFGMYTYFVEFKELSNLIAENDPVPVQEEETDSPEPTDQENEPPTDDVNYGVLYLSDLKIEGIDFTFEPDKRVYNLEIEGNISRLNIDTKSYDSAVTINISDNANEIKEGMNTITISLSDPYNNTGLYVLNIDKKKNRSSNNYLANLTVEKYQLNFDPSITSYTLEIGKESILNITPIPESELATFQVLGNANLSDGSQIIIRVTAENETTKDYTINIKRSFNIMDYWIYIVIVMLVILLIIILLMSKKRKKKDKMGPAALEGQTETAGVVQEVASQNQNSATTTSTEGGVEQSNTQISESPGTLKIIEPTNIEVPVEAAASTEPATETLEITEDAADTEVFQL